MEAVGEPRRRDGAAGAATLARMELAVRRRRRGCGSRSNCRSRRCVTEIQFDSTGAGGGGGGRAGRGAPPAAAAGAGAPRQLRPERRRPRHRAQAAPPAAAHRRRAPAPQGPAGGPPRRWTGGGAPAFGYPRGYSVQVSTDGTTWSKPVAEGKGDGARTTITFAPTRAKMVRITQTDTAADAPELEYQQSARLRGAGQVARRNRRAERVSPLAPLRTLEHAPRAGPPPTGALAFHPTGAQRQSRIDGMSCPCSRM